MNYKCTSCGNEEEITFKISGLGLKQMEIIFNCPKCDCPHRVLAVFPPDGGKAKVKIEKEFTNYIG